MEAAPAAGRQGPGGAACSHGGREDGTHKFGLNQLSHQPATNGRHSPGRADYRQPPGCQTNSGRCGKKVPASPRKAPAPSALSGCLRNSSHPSCPDLLRPRAAPHGAPAAPMRTGRWSSCAPARRARTCGALMKGTSSCSAAHDMEARPRTASRSPGTATGRQTRRVHFQRAPEAVPLRGGPALKRPPSPARPRPAPRGWTRRRTVIRGT